MQSSSAKIEISQPRLFTAGALAVVSAYGILLAAPFCISVLVISTTRFGIHTALIPLFVVMATAYFLPFGLGNTYIARLVQSLNPSAGQSEAGFIVQLTLSPRIRSGLWQVLEDADDIGCLSFTATELLFQGDSVKLTIPFSCIEAVQPKNIGLRGLFVYGRRITVLVSGLPEIESFEFAERSSRLLPASRTTASKLYARLSATLPQTRSTVEP